MDFLEFNKIALAVLTAGIVAMLSGFFATILVHSDPAPEQQAYVIATPGEGAGEATQAVAKEPEDILTMIASADTAAGEGVTKKCTACHSFDEGGANKIGPNLWDIVGRQVAAVDGFGYSSALTDKSGEAWTYENLSGFLEKPKSWAPGTKMAYAGLKKAKDRANLIAYLRELSNDPQPLPEPAAAPEMEDEVPEGEAAEGEAAEGEMAASEPASEESAEDAMPAQEEEMTQTAEASDTQPAEEAATAEAEADAGAAAETDAGGGGSSGLGAQIAAVDPAAGKKVARKCTACHSFESGGKNKIGPNLYGVIGKPIASAEGYKYSSAMAGKASEAWTYDNLAAYLANPKKWLPGTKMSFAGLKKEDDIAAILAYLRENHDSPPPLP